MSLAKANSKPLGILGGGQLARMLALRAHELGIPVSVLSENPDDPAAQVTSLWQQGKLTDRKRLREFLSSCSVVTFESEFMDAEILAQLEREVGTQIFPKPKHMAQIQDRLSQKQLLVEHRLPTADFVEVSTPEQARNALSALGGQAVFKKRRFGYDGYGTFVVRSARDLKRFLPELGQNPHGFIAERFIPFQRELAIMVFRGRSRETTHLPFVETYQENSRCLWVKGPLKSNTQLKKLANRLEEFLKSTGYIGTIGVELFATREGLLINELAPRVHNSGHYSMDAMSEDQFGLHLKAVLGMKIDPPALVAKGFAMMNLLGSHDRTPAWRLPSDVHFHWYGKSENRKGRKMGHINSLGSTPEQALDRVKSRRNEFKV